MSAAALDQALLAAHAAADSPALVRLYTQAADQAEAGGRTDAACFFLTQAFVFALEAGLPDAASLNRRLAALGRSHLVAL